jgi:hypothetical protein
MFTIGVMCLMSFRYRVCHILLSKYISDRKASYELESRSWRGVLDKTLCYNVCQGLAARIVNNTNIFNKKKENKIKQITRTVNNIIIFNKKKKTKQN